MNTIFSGHTHEVISGRLPQRGLARASETMVGGAGVVDFRHLQLFRRAYLERDYTSVAVGTGAAKRSVVKTIRDLELAFEETLFIEDSRGRLVPTPFSERLFNDSAKLQNAVAHLMEEVEIIRNHSRVLRLGATAAVFRTAAFRKAFLRLQELPGVRTAYVPIEVGDAAKALSQGHCDLYLGFLDNAGDRFESTIIGKIPVREYLRGNLQDDSPRASYALQMDFGYIHDRANQHSKRPKLKLSEQEWMDWLSHPSSCERGTVVQALEVSVDERFWTTLPVREDSPYAFSLSATYLKQHPFEFLPGLCEQLKSRP
ncbi:hypothetical protein ACFSSA_02930 [Luteolibacter algae]|uniref:LysR family transcriptional regulator n=1 Tax=Luteolibacter algae TaxID=454151 RepID=A0ABW5D3I1_9BACT